MPLQGAFNRINVSKTLKTMQLPLKDEETDLIKSQA